MKKLTTKIMDDGDQKSEDFKHEKINHQNYG